jgi:hypothetical protein
MRVTDSTSKALSILKGLFGFLRGLSYGEVVISMTVEGVCAATARSCSSVRWGLRFLTSLPRDLYASRPRTCGCFQVDGTLCTDDQQQSSRHETISSSPQRDTVSR